MAIDPNSKPFGSSETASCQQHLPAIDETRPSVDFMQPDLQSDLQPELGMEAEVEDDEGKIRSFSRRPESDPCRKKCMKDRLRGLKDKYVSCLYAIDGAGDMRGCAASGGGPALVPAANSQPYGCVKTAASISTATIAN